MIRSASLGCHADVGDASVLGTESIRKHIQFTDSFERWFSLRGLTEDAAVRALTIYRKAGAVALRSDEFEVTGLIALRNIGIDVEKGVNIAAVARKIDNC